MDTIPITLKREWFAKIVDRTKRQEPSDHCRMCRLSANVPDRTLRLLYSIAATFVLYVLSTGFDGVSGSALIY